MRTLTWLMLLVTLMLLGYLDTRTQVQRAYNEGRADGYAFARQHADPNVIGE